MATPRQSLTNRLPLPVLAFLIVQSCFLVALIVLGGRGAIPDTVISLVIAVGVAMGSRVAWWLAVIAVGANLALVPLLKTWPFAPTTWAGLITLPVLLVLLLTRSTRRHCEVAIGT